MLIITASEAWLLNYRDKLTIIKVKVSFLVLKFKFRLSLVSAGEQVRIDHGYIQVFRALVVDCYYQIVIQIAS